MSVDNPEDGDVWGNEHRKLRIIMINVQDHNGDEVRYIDEYLDKGATSINSMLINYSYLGKSKTNIDDLFEVQDD